jgi:uncharacterized protein YcgL (UPF0745 family)
MNKEIMDPLVKKILVCVQKLLNNNPIKIKELETELFEKFKYLGEGKINKYSKKTKTRQVSGIYLIYRGGKERKDIIYVGETDNLVRRLVGDIGEARISNEKLFHTLNRYIKKSFPNYNTSQIKEEIEQHYYFSYLETDDKELALAIEGLMIKYLRKIGNNLINHK